MNYVYVTISELFPAATYEQRIEYIQYMMGVHHPVASQLTLA